jgi:hypothetical protein
LFILDVSFRPTTCQGKRENTINMESSERFLYTAVTDNIYDYILVSNVEKTAPSTELLYQSSLVLSSKS